MNALVKSGGNANALAAMGSADPFAQAAADMGSSSASYVKFNGNTGEYSAGQENTILPHGGRYAVNMHEMKRGYICWKNEQVVDELLVKIMDGTRLPAVSELPDHGPYEKSEDRTDGWAEQSSMQWKDPETGEEFIFKVSSGSALRSIGTFLKDYARSYKLHPGMVPIIEIGAQSFMPKKKTYGKKYAPTIKIVDWKSEDELMALTGDDADDYEGAREEVPAPAPKASTASAPAAAPKPAARPAPKPAPAPKYPPIETDENGFPIYYDNGDGTFTLSNGQPCDDQGTPLPEPEVNEDAGVDWDQVAQEEAAPAPAPAPRPAPRPAPKPAAAAPQPAPAPAPPPAGGPRRRQF